MTFFQIVDNDLVLNRIEILLVKEFGDYFTKDRSKDKTKSFAVFKYVYLVYDWQSPYFTESFEERQNKAFKDSGLLPKDIDEKIENLIDIYEELQEIQAPSFKTLKMSLDTLNALNRYFEKIDFNEKDKKGELVHNISTVITSVSKIGDLRTTINKLIEQVKSEVASEKKRSKANRSQSPIEAGLFKRVRDENSIDDN